MKIAPSSRDLKTLSEFDDWQCDAELVDNAFDGFAEIVKSGIPRAGGFKVSVSLPSHDAKSHEASVIIQDAGRGMSYEELAVRADWSNNDRFDKLGPFAIVTQKTERGMSYRELLAVLRARRSNRDRFDKLGLFGMGFKVGTALLNRRIRTLTTSALPASN
ncbi:hypothetical protein [Nonomuraea sp. NPDC049141]|uniref:hypothetical protein n=1 Tax=Nonomuraea sp. NPDC049141 TaxID=3155500 RepID=UPI0033DA967B